MWFCCNDGGGRGRAPCNLIPDTLFKDLLPPPAADWSLLPESSR